MIVKAFEIRDKGTFIPVLAVKMVPVAYPDVASEPERYLLRRAGYNTFETEPCVVLCRMECDGGPRQASYDPFSWGNRTFQVAHHYIVENFDTLKSGDVVDVEFLLKETTEPKKSERVS